MLHVLTIVGLSLVLALPGWAATLESPAPGANLSGLGFISGWKCNAGRITVRIDQGSPLPVLYGNDRLDTHVSRGGPCQRQATGYIMQINWAELGDGEHSVVVYDNGREFARATFSVMTFGEAFVEDAAGLCTIQNFPAPGEWAEFTWNESTQHLELNALSSPQPPEEEDPPEPSLEERCTTADGAVDMCCVCCDVEGRTIPICTDNPQIAERCRYRPKGCGPSNPDPPLPPHHGECGENPYSCLSGRPYGLQGSVTHFRWECVGNNGGRTVTCEAPRDVPDPFAPFQGAWTFSSTITANCSAVDGRGELRVHRSRLSGWFRQNETVRTGDGTYRTNVLQQIGGSLSESGVVNGLFRWKERTVGQFTGTLSGRSGSGTWNDTAGCVGRWNVRKQP